MPEGGGQVRFTQTDAAEENDVGVLVDKLQTKEVLHLGAIELVWPGPLEGIEGLDERDARLADKCPPCVSG